MVKIDKNDINSCWICLKGFTTGRGYRGKLINGKWTSMHRLMYTIFIGKIPRDMTLDHLCRRKNCINPFHLEVVTRKENILRSFCPPAMNARKTHCIRGHKFDYKNTRTTGSRGIRECRKCDNLKHRIKKIKLKAKMSPHDHLLLSKWSVEDTNYDNII